jgi:hypothetical protein
MGYYGVDLYDASAGKEVAERAAELIPRQDSGTVWYVGHWGFQYYAERAGMKPVVPGSSHLHRNDWLVLPNDSINQQKIQIDPNALALIDTLSAGDLLPVRTVSGYYGSRVPLEPNRGPCMVVRVYRVIADFIPTPLHQAASAIGSDSRTDSVVPLESQDQTQ